MLTIAAWARRHPALAYFILTFLISWGGVLALGSPYGMPTTPGQFDKVWVIVFLPYFFGPLASGLMMTALVDGRAGMRELGARLLRWRGPIGWYALALLAAPLLVLLILLPLSLASADYMPAIFVSDNRPSIIIMGVVVGLVFGGLFEELGWTGFAAPKLLERHGILHAGSLLGIMWGIWHILPTFWGSGDAAGAVVPALFLPPCVFYAGVLPAYRVLMVGLYDVTRSLPVIMLMHGSLTASTLFILAPAASGWALVLYYLILTGAMWLAVGLLIGRAGRTRPGRVPSAGPAA